MLQFLLYALKGAVLGGVIGGIGFLALAGGHSENATVGAFVGALFGALIGMKAHTPSHIYGRSAYLNHYPHNPSSAHIHGSLDQIQTTDIGGAPNDGGGIDTGGFDGGGTS